MTASKNDWTPGPWCALERAPWIVAENGNGLEIPANAQLAAAAPDLYEALYDRWMEGTGQYDKKSCGHRFTCICISEKTVAALRKARGEMG